MITENLPSLKINKLTQEQYDAAKAAGKINENELYMTPDSSIIVTDIVDDLTTNVSNKPLSAAQGVKLKALIDGITVPTKVSELQNDAGYLTQHQDISGKAEAVSLIDSTLQAQANLTPAEILQAMQAGKILMAIGGVCTLMSNSGTSQVVVHRQYNDSNIVAKVTINSDKSYTVELINLEKISNKVTSLSASSTDTQYPSAKCVYDMIGNVETLLAAL